MDSMISLGIDPSWSHTGLAVVECEVESGEPKLKRVIYTALSAPTNRADIERFFMAAEALIGSKVLDADIFIRLDAAGIEAAYVGPNPAYSLDLAQVGGYCYYGLHGFNPDVEVHWLTAQKWRAIVLKHEGRAERREKAKKDAYDWVEEQLGAIPDGISEHEIEACCIACAACVKETNKRGEH